MSGRPIRRSSRAGLPFRNLRRAEVDYTDAGDPAGGAAAGPAGISDQRRGLHRQAQRRRLRDPQGGMPARQRRPARGSWPRRARRPGCPGATSRRAASTAATRPGRARVHRGGHAELHFARATARSTAAPRPWARRCWPASPASIVWRLRIPFDSVDNPRNYLTKLMRYPRLLEATNSISQLDEFAAATLACWKSGCPSGPTT